MTCSRLADYLLERFPSCKSSVQEADLEALSRLYAVLAKLKMPLLVSSELKQRIEELRRLIDECRLDELELEVLRLAREASRSRMRQGALLAGLWIIVTIVTLLAAPLLFLLAAPLLAAVTGYLVNRSIC